MSELQFTLGGGRRACWRGQSTLGNRSVCQAKHPAVEELAEGLRIYNRLMTHAGKNAPGELQRFPNELRDARFCMLRWPGFRTLRREVLNHARRLSILAGILLVTLHAGAAEPSRASLEAARLNNIGVALMNQQLTDKALQRFDEAHKTDATAAVPLLNKGIALLYLRRLPEAEEALKAASQADAMNARVWYSLGLAHFDGGGQQLALADFQHAAQIDPGDADSHYFLGTIYLGLKDYEHAISQFEDAIRLNPLHASAQFGLARALQRAGMADKSREHLKRFQEITQAKIGTPLSAVYGEQGRYATVQDMRSPAPAVGAMIPVSFVPQELSGGRAVSASAPVGTGAGICILDVEGKGQKDILVLGDGPSALRAYRFEGGSLSEVSLKPSGLLVEGHGISCAVGDYDNDGLPDLAVALSDRIALFHNLGHGKFAETTTAVGIRSLNHPAGLTFVDFDHDGDLDLFITGAPGNSGVNPNVLWRNNGNSTFTEWTSAPGLGGKGETTAASLSDLNNDRAVDLVVTGAGSAPTLYENQREGAFKQVALYGDGQLSPTRGVAVSDFNKDGWMDVAVTHVGAPGLSLWRNLEGKSFERVALPIADARGGWGLTPIDFDNDGWIDLAVLVETGAGTQLRVLRNMGPGGFTDVSESLGLTKLKLDGARSLIAVDLQGSGAADLIVSRLNAPPLVLRNVGGEKNHSLRIALTGLADNKSALGTKVEVFANGMWQKFEVASSSGYQSQGSTEILAGLGQNERADVVRMLWPTGVPQDELDVAASKPVALTELDRRGSSCPVLFAWNGSKYEFISDVIGAAVVGHWVSPTSKNQSDSDEWIKVNGSSLKSRSGLLSLRFGEPMEEINYIDRLRLVAVDHPEGTEVYPNERFLSETPFAAGNTVVASRSTRPPAGAWDDKGRDVRDLLARQDHNYVRDFDNLSYAGFANPHTLTLDLGPWSAHNPLRLFLHGFIEYFSASSMYAAWQAGITPEPPSVEAQMPDGTWKRVIDDMGFPAGLPRTIVVDLTGKVPPTARKIRLRTNLQIYWDQVLVDNGQDASGVAKQIELPLVSAHLAFRGYPKQVDGATPGDITYDYQSISATGPFQWQRGSYTRYGSVTPLLLAKDNQYVIFGSGEDMDAEFSDAALAALPPHWKRDYFFYADGFVKDMDFYEALPFTVAELPFHEMSGYPYPENEHFPDDATSLNYHLDWNDRFESGDRTQPYQFRYKPTVSEPIADHP